MRKEQIQNDLKKHFGKSLKFTIATHRGALSSDYYTINIQGAEIDDIKILESLVRDVANGKSVCLDDGSNGRYNSVHDYYCFVNISDNFKLLTNRG